MNQELADQVILWHTENGGFNARPAGHACRLLREVVELCFASGATATDIANAVMDEVKKETSKHTFAKTDPEAMKEEVADVDILLEVFKIYNGIDINEAVEEKLQVLYERLWEVDGDGVLWRPGARTQEQLYPDEPAPDGT
jgi:hypothetical protein